MRLDDFNGISFSGLLVVERDYVRISGMLDNMDECISLTRSSQHVARDGGKWGKSDNKFRTISLCLYFDENNWRYQVELGENGDISIAGKSGIVIESLPGVGAFSPGVMGLGYLSDIRQIGSMLYACGASGQVYKRIGPDEWIHMDEGLLQHPDTPSDTEDRHWLTCIRGISEDQIYVVGDWGLIYYWNGKVWTKIDCPERKALNRIYIENPDRIWVCGHKGILLLGNHRDGFINVSPTEELLFTSITMFNGELYLASDQGLYRFEEKQGRMRKVKTDGLKPLHTDSHYIDAKDGVLWSVGIKDIVWTDGKIWHRVDHPDNPPYGT